MTLTEFVRKLEVSETPFDVFTIGETTYVEVEKHFGFRFDSRGDFNGGWILHPLGAWQAEWKS